MNINTLDLNLFLVFKAIYVSRSVTVAGEELHISQSAVSNALKRLRDRFGDQLFVRSPTGMLPTALADQLIGPIEEGLLKFSQAIHQVERFDPLSSQRLFRIAINDIGQLVLMPRLLRTLRALAPQVRIETVDAASALDARQMLVDGKVDLAIGSWDTLGAGFHVQDLLQETFVALMARDHPFQTDSLSIEQYMAAEHVAYRPSGRSDFALQTKLEAAGGVFAQRKVVLTVAHSLGLATIVASSNLVLSAQVRLADAMVQSRNDLRWAHLPFKVDPFPVRQQWHERMHADSGHQWLRRLTYTSFVELPAPFGDDGMRTPLPAGF